MVSLDPFCPPSHGPSQYVLRSNTAGHQERSPQELGWAAHLFGVCRSTRGARGFLFYGSFGGRSCKTPMRLWTVAPMVISSFKLLLRGSAAPDMNSGYKSSFPKVARRAGDKMLAHWMDIVTDERKAMGRQVVRWCVQEICTRSPRVYLAGGGRC